MKKTSLVLFVFFLLTHAEAQTLFTYGKKSVSVAEFLRAYNKNTPPTQTEKEKKIREYIDLYANFKLKVQAATAMGLDTAARLQEEANQFRQQIVENYLKDEASYNALYKEAIQRSQQVKHVLHFFIRVDSNALPKDTLQAAQLIKTAYDQLSKATGDEAAIATRLQIQFKDLGHVTVFSLPYAYENIVFGLKPGQVSIPYRSKKAWHLFKVLTEQKHPGKWEVAQILFSFPSDASEAIKQSILHKADSVYRLLQQGADFASLARQCSEDKSTFLTGGKMPVFGPGKYEYAFEKEVFGLTTDGAYTAPFITPFGVHIVKRIKVTPITTGETEDALSFDVKQQLSQDDRMRISKEKFTASIRAKTGFSILSNVSKNMLFQYADSMKQLHSNDYIDQLSIAHKPIIRFVKDTLKAKDWLVFVRDYTANKELYKNQSNQVLWDQYTAAVIVDNYKKHLEDHNPDFKYQLQEFVEGNLLFEIMEQKVWSMSAMDTAQLRAYYTTHRSQYTWPESADMLVVTSTNDKTAQATLEQLRAGADWQNLVTAKPNELQADSGRYELAQFPFLTQPKAGQCSSIQVNEDGTYTFVRLYTLYPKGQLRDFESAKGSVINDYQNQLETNWVKELRKKHPVLVNEGLVQKLIK